jgi:hypothetical protein
VSEDIGGTWLRISGDDSKVAHGGVLFHPTSSSNLASFVGLRAFDGGVFLLMPVAWRPDDIHRDVKFCSVVSIAVTGMHHIESSQPLTR